MRSKIDEQVNQTSIYFSIEILMTFWVFGRLKEGGGHATSSDESGVGVPKMNLKNSS